MSDKSHVGMGFNMCPICRAKHDEVVLLHKRLQPVLPRESFMGFTLCPECDKQADEYIALIECDNPPNEQHRLTPHNASHTGNICRVRRAVAPRIFNVELPANLPFVYVEVGVIAKIQSLTTTKEQSDDKEA